MEHHPIFRRRLFRNDGMVEEKRSLRNASYVGPFALETVIAPVVTWEPRTCFLLADLLLVGIKALEEGMAAGEVDLVE